MKTYYLSISTKSRNEAPISFWVAYRDTHTVEFQWKGWDNSKTTFVPSIIAHLPNSSTQFTFEISEELATTLSSLTPVEVYPIVQQHYPEVFI